MNKILSVIIILAFIISTITAAIIKPSLYKQVLFSSKTVEITQNTPEIQEKEIHVKEIKPLAQKQETLKLSGDKKVEKTEKTLKTVKKEEEKTKTPEKPELPNSIKEIITRQQAPEIKTTVEKLKEPAPVEKPANIQKEYKNPLQQQQRELTEQEELIVWNRWRSNLQNKVMKDVKIDAPLGTRFRFSFTVDRYGQISNLKVWSENPEYTSLAISRIKPLLLSYQGQPVLNFPQGTKRIVTNVTGGFVLATFDKYSKPSDYSDVERVKYLR